MLKIQIKKNGSVREYIIKYLIKAKLDAKNTSRSKMAEMTEKR